MAQKDATQDQLAKLKAIRKEFPSARKRGYRVDPRTGVMRVELQSIGGVHHWWFGRDGQMIDTAYHPHLPSGVDDAA